MLMCVVIKLNLKNRILQSRHIYQSGSGTFHPIVSIFVVVVQDCHP